MRSSLVVAIVLAGGCASSTPSRPGTTGAREATAEAEQPPPAVPAPTAEVVVVARVIDRGPIGDGACVQCSYEVRIEERVSGDLEADDETIWVHYEACGGAAPSPSTSEVDPCALRASSRYELTLRPGGSPNFGEAPMIVAVRPR